MPDDAVDELEGGELLDLGEPSVPEAAAGRDRTRRPDWERWADRRSGRGPSRAVSGDAGAPEPSAEAPGARPRSVGARPEGLRWHCQPSAATVRPWSARIDRAPSWRRQGRPRCGSSTRLEAAGVGERDPGVHDAREAEPGRGPRVGSRRRPQAASRPGDKATVFGRRLGMGW